MKNFSYDDSNENLSIITIIIIIITIFSGSQKNIYFCWMKMYIYDKNVNLFKVTISIVIITICSRFQKTPIYIYKWKSIFVKLKIVYDKDVICTAMSSLYPSSGSKGG